jgi:hypothetical protein
MVSNPKRSVRREKTFGRRAQCRADYPEKRNRIVFYFETGTVVEG